MPGQFKTEAVVLRTFRYGEADRILHLYTAERGRVGAIAKGVRRVKSRFGGRLEPLFRVNLVLHQGRGELCTVTQVETVAENDTDAVALDVRVVSLAMPAKADQAVVAQRLVEAEQIRKRFTACENLDSMVKGVEGVSVKAMKTSKLSDFRGDVKAALTKAQPGQMTPPVIAGAAIESYALCGKKQSVATGKNTEKQAEAPDKTQEVFQLYSKRHLKDLKEQARLDYKKGNG